MKFESDTEIDRLLRRHARRERAPASFNAASARKTDGDDESAALLRAGGAHLDADEMNAYAEGALPDASRAGYFSHLADCDECRSMVVKLTLAANVATKSGAQPSAIADSASRSWRDWLAALFAPAVLRYAVPALALLAVMIVAFVATRGRREANLVAQNEQRESSSATAPVNRDEQPAPPTTNTTVAPNKNGAAAENSNTAAISPRQADAATEAPQPSKQAGKKEAETDQNTLTVQGEPKPAEQSASGGDLIRQTRERDEGVTMAKAQPPPVAAAPAVKSPADDEGRDEEEDAKKPVESNEKNKTAVPSPATSTGGIFHDGGGNREQTNTRRAPEIRRERPARGNSSADTQLSSEAAGPNVKDDRAGETRSAGGRQFRRQGGTWVDTAYNSSRSTIGVARGSEQYRALIADEPGIRTIADQLGGTVVVVWKNRAYRIY